MKLSGEAVLNAPVAEVWTALHDPEVLVRTIPGCERLQTTGENRYDMTVSAGVAAVRGTYTGTCQLRDVEPPSSLVLRAEGAGASGTIATDVDVHLSDNGDGTTKLRYDADAVVGGMLGGVGQRMLGSVSRRMAGEFFGNVEQALAGTLAQAAPRRPEQPASAGSATHMGETFVAPARPAGGSEEFLKGVAVGAGLVLLGVLAGSFSSRRRR